MDCLVGGLGQKPQRRRPRSLLLATRGETDQSLDGGGSSSSNIADHGAGETSGRFWNAAATSLTTAAALTLGRRRGGA